MYGVCVLSEGGGGAATGALLSRMPLSCVSVKLLTLFECCALNKK